jgi:hypothetical protein
LQQPVVEGIDGFIVDDEERILRWAVARQRHAADDVRVILWPGRRSASAMTISW